MPAPLNKSALLQVANDTTSETFLVGFAFSAGRTAIATFNHFSTTGQIASVTIGGTAATRRYQAVSGTTRGELWEAAAIAGGTNQVVVTYSAGTDNFVTGSVEEWAPGLTFITSNTATGTSATPLVQALDITQTHTLVYASAVPTTGATNNAHSGPSAWERAWIEQNNSTVQGGVSAFITETNAGTKTAAFGINSQAWAAGIAVFSVAGAPPTPDPGSGIADRPAWAGLYGRGGQRNIASGSARWPASKANSPIFNDALFESAAVGGAHDLVAALASQSSALSASFARIGQHDLGAALSSQNASLSASLSRTRVHGLSSSLQAQGATLSAAFARVGTHSLSVELQSQSATLSGSFTRTSPQPSHDLAAALNAQGATLSAAFSRVGQHALSATLNSQSATISASFARVGTHLLSVGLASGGATLAASFSRTSVHDLTASLSAQNAALAAAFLRTTPSSNHELAASLPASSANLLAQFNVLRAQNETGSGGIADWVALEVRRRAVEDQIRRTRKVVVQDQAKREQQDREVAKASRQLDREVEVRARAMADQEEADRAQQDAEFARQLSEMITKATRSKIVAEKLRKQREKSFNEAKARLYAEFRASVELEAASIVAKAYGAAWLIALSQ